MLRTAVLAFATLLAAIGVYLLLKGITVPGVQALGVGIVIILGTLFERWRYGGSPGAGDSDGDGRLDARWQATGERFADPTTGEEVEVFYDPSSGERRYKNRHDGSL
jgi:hypothetical protein